MKRYEFVSVINGDYIFRGGNDFYRDIYADDTIKSPGTDTYDDMGMTKLTDESEIELAQRVADLNRKLGDFFVVDLDTENGIAEIADESEKMYDSEKRYRINGQTEAIFELTVEALKKMISKG